MSLLLLFKPAPGILIISRDTVYVGTIQNSILLSQTHQDISSLATLDRTFTISNQNNNISIDGVSDNVGISNIQQSISLNTASDTNNTSNKKDVASTTQSNDDLFSNRIY